MDIDDWAITAAVFLFPAVGAWLLSRMAYTALKKRESKWKLPVAILVFLLTYAATFIAIVIALVNAIGFHR